MQLRCGIDLGGTKIEGVLMSQSGSSFEVLERLRLPTEKEKGYEHVKDQVASVMHLLEEKSGIQIKTIGIGTPGILDPLTQTMKNSNTVCLIGQPLKQDLIEKLGIPVEMANDANCFTLAEATLGIVPDKFPSAQVVFGVIMGTGVGGGIAIDGKVINGRQGIAGEWGHNFLDESGGPCYCGKTGCVETIISGTGLENYYSSLVKEKKNFKEIVQLYKEGSSKAATQTMERLITFYGKSIASIINVLDPDIIVLGGGVGNVDLLYDAGCKSAEKYIFNEQLNTVFLKPKLGDSAGVFGAAMLNSSWEI